MFPSFFNRPTISIPRIISGVSKTLNLINKGLPIYRQVSPMISKGRKLLKNNISNITKNTSTKALPPKAKTPSVKIKNTNSNGLVFFQ